MSPCWWINEGFLFIASLFSLEMKVLPNAYRFLNLISVDIACGAMVCAAFFAHIFHIQLLHYGIASLGITVWIIYTVDHLLDASRLKGEASTRRHRFHQRYFVLISMVVIIALLIDVYMVLHVRRQVFSWGLGLAVLVFLYLLLQRWISPFKEFVAALLYSGGIFLPAFSLWQGIISGPIIYLMIVFVLTALINLILFSMFDLEEDLKHTQPSLVIFSGEQNAKIILRSLFFLQALLISSLIFITQYKAEAFVLATMNFVLCLLFVLHHRFKNEDNYRLFGDIIFLFPLFYLIVNG